MNLKHIAKKPFNMSKTLFTKAFAAPVAGKRKHLTTLTTLLLSLCLAIPASGQTQRRSAPYVELMPGVSLQEGGGTNIGLNFGYLWNTHSPLSLGFGLGVVESTDFDDTPGASVFFRGRYDFDTKGKLKPFAMLDVGTTLFISTKSEAAVFSTPVSPTVGLDFGHFYVGVGYNAYIFPTADFQVSHMANLKLGWTIGRGVKKEKIKKTNTFLRHTYLKVEVGHDEGLTTATHNQKADGSGAMKLSDIGTSNFARVAWMYRLNDNLDLGLGTGFDMIRYHDKPTQGPDEGWDNGSTNYYLPIYARAQYNFRSAEDDWRPYVACDLGGRVHLNNNYGYSESGFMASPQVGVAWKRVSLSAEATLSSYNYIDETVGYGTNFDTEKKHGLACSVGLRLGVKI